MNLATYPEYKNSGFSWLAAVPVHWNFFRLDRLFMVRREQPIEGDQRITGYLNGRVTLRSNVTGQKIKGVVKEAGWQRVHAGDFAISGMNAHLGGMGVSDSTGKCSPIYLVLKPKENTNAFFVSYFVRHLAHIGLLKASVSTIRFNSADFKQADLKLFWVVIPPREEQDAIVRFLNAQDAQFSRLIRAKRKMIALLNEQKSAIIHRAVTRGLNPDAPMKPSGLPWVGDVPEHWELGRAKQACLSIVDCKNRTPELIANGGFRVVRTTNIRNGKFNIEGSFETDFENYKIWTQRGAPKQGDVFFTREAPAGEACLVPDMKNLCMGQRMMYFRPDPNILDAKFLLYTIYGPLVRRYIDLACNGSTVGHLRLGQVFSLPILLCPIEEQRVIVAHLETEIQRLDSVLIRVQREIDLILEYRTRLVCDVVTGQLDVRAAAASLCDEDTSEPVPLGIDDETGDEDELEGDDE